MFLTDAGKLYICVAGDGSKVLVVVDFINVYLWQLNPGGTIFDAVPLDTRGHWSRVGRGSERVVDLPDGGHTEACIHAVFCVNDRCVSMGLWRVVKALLIEQCQLYTYYML